jgi:hypothetical protein
VTLPAERRGRGRSAGEEQRRVRLLSSAALSDNTFEGNPMKKILISAAAAVAAVPMLLAGAATASAAPADCNTAVFYYDGNETGAEYYAFCDDVPDLAGHYYNESASDGSGQAVKNNTASVWNASSSWLCIYYNENYQGQFDSIAPGGRANLIYTWNNDASYRFLGQHC